MASNSHDAQTADSADQAPSKPEKLPSTSGVAEEPIEDDFPKPAGFDTDGDGNVGPS